MKINNKQSDKKNKTIKRVIVLALMAVLALAAVGVYGYNQGWFGGKNGVQPSPTTRSTKTPTKKESSEGTSFPVPKDTPADSIKDYELLVENEQYKIRHEKGSNRYIVTLYPIVNNPGQYSTYNDQLREYKANALKYLSDQNLDTNTLDIEYEPEEANDL